MDDYGCILLLSTAVAQYSNMSDDNPHIIKISDVYVEEIKKTKVGFFAKIKTTVDDNVQYEAFYKWEPKSISLRVFKEIDNITIKLGEL